MNRVSLGAQSFQPRAARECSSARRGPDDVRRAVHTLRDAGFDNISLDLIYGIPGQSAADLERDLAEALALEPEHLSCYELEAKPGTRFTHAHGEELARQAEAMEGYFERVVETLTAAGYRWYETANFCRRRRAGGAISAHGTTSATGAGATTSGSASAPSRRSRGRRWRNDAERSGATSPRSSRSAPAARASRSSTTRDAAAERVHARPPPRRAAAARGTRRRRRRGRRSRGSSASGSPSGTARTVALTPRGRLPRRRGHGRAARRKPATAVSSACTAMQSATRDRPHRAPARRSSRASSRSYVAHRAAGRLEDASSSARACASRRRPCVPSSPSSRRSGCSRTRTPRRAASRPTAATGVYVDGLLERLGAAADLPARPLGEAPARSTPRCRRRRRRSPR